MYALRKFARLTAAIVVASLALFVAPSSAQELKIAVAADVTSNTIWATRKGVQYVPRTDEYTLAFQFKTAGGELARK